MRIGMSLAISLLAFFPAVAADEGPEDVARRFMQAVYSHDKASFDSAIVPNPRADRLLGKKHLSFAEANEIFRETAAMEFKNVQPFTFRGSPAAAGNDGQYPIGTRVRYMTGYRGTPLVVTVVRAAAGWRVDVRWWLAMIDQGPEPQPKPGTPDFAIKALITALVTDDREHAKDFITPGGDAALLFAEAPAEPDHSDQVVLLALEMPLVEIPPNEFYALPSGRIVEGFRDSTREKLLVGLYGPLEMPFIVRRIGGKWRVVPEPYFKILNRG